MTLPNMRAPFQAPASQEQESEILKALKALPREQEPFDVGPILGLDGERKVIFRVATKEEQDLALAAAHSYVAKRCEQTPEAAKDPDLLVDAKAAFILSKVLREGDGTMPVFVSGEIVSKHLTPDKIGALLRCANMVRAKHQPWPTDLSDETVEQIVALCSAAGGEIPERVLAGCTDVMLAQLVLVLCAKLETARAEADMHRAHVDQLRTVVEAQKSTVGALTSDESTDAG